MTGIYHIQYCRSMQGPRATAIEIACWCCRRLDLLELYYPRYGNSRFFGVYFGRFGFNCMLRALLPGAREGGGWAFRCFSFFFLLAVEEEVVQNRKVLQRHMHDPRCCSYKGSRTGPEISIHGSHLCAFSESRYKHRGDWSQISFN